MEDLTIIKMALGGILGALVHIGYTINAIHTELRHVNENN